MQYKTMAATLFSLTTLGLVTAEGARISTYGTNPKSPIQVGAPTMEMDKERRSCIRCTISNISDKEVQQLKVGATIYDPSGKEYRTAYIHDLPLLAGKGRYDYVSFFSNDAQIPLGTLTAKVWVSHAP
jgi:hypothetical protein